MGERKLADNNQIKGDQRVTGPSLIFRTLVTFLAALSLAGCGVTKLWGNEAPITQEDVRPGMTLREQASELSKTSWEVEEKTSFMSTMAGVLVNGARSAGQALDVFDWTESESPETRTAKTYLSHLKDERGEDRLFGSVLGDLKTKNRAATAFRIEGVEALDFYHAALEAAGKEPDNSLRKDQTKHVLGLADEDRRAVIQASKSLRLQASVFEEAGNVLKIKDPELDVSPLQSEVGQLLLRADELRALAEELDLD